MGLSVVNLQSVKVYYYVQIEWLSLEACENAHSSTRANEPAGPSLSPEPLAEPNVTSPPSVPTRSPIITRTRTGTVINPPNK